MDMGFVNDWRRRSASSSFNSGGAKEQLFLHYCERVENGMTDPLTTDSMAVVDNFYVNGEFKYKSDCTEREWRTVKSNCIDWCDTDEGAIAIMNF